MVYMRCQTTLSQSIEPTGGSRDRYGDWGRELVLYLGRYAEGSCTMHTSTSTTPRAAARRRRHGACGVLDLSANFVARATKFWNEFLLAKARHLRASVVSFLSRRPLPPPSH